MVNYLKTVTVKSTDTACPVSCPPSSTLTSTSTSFSTSTTRTRTHASLSNASFNGTTATLPSSLPLPLSSSLPQPLPSSLPQSSPSSLPRYLNTPCAITIARSAVDGFIPLTSPPPPPPSLPPSFPPSLSNSTTIPSSPPSTSSSTSSSPPAPLPPYTSPSPSTFSISSIARSSSSSSLPGHDFNKNINSHDRILGVDEIQKKVLFAVEKLLEYWAIQESKIQDPTCDTSNTHDNRNNDNKKHCFNRMTVHDLTVDAAEVASTMFLHPSLRANKSTNK